MTSSPGSGSPTVTSSRARGMARCRRRSSTARPAGAPLAAGGAAPRPRPRRRRRQRPRSRPGGWAARSSAASRSVEPVRGPRRRRPGRRPGAFAVLARQLAQQLTAGAAPPPDVAGSSSQVSTTWRSSVASVAQLGLQDGQTAAPSSTQRSPTRRGRLGPPPRRSMTSRARSSPSSRAASAIGGRFAMGGGLGQPVLLGRQARRPHRDRRARRRRSRPAGSAAGRSRGPGPARRRPGIRAQPCRGTARRARASVEGPRSMPAKASRARRWTAGVEQRLLGVLAVEVDQAGPGLGQGRHRCHATVDPGPRPSLGGHRPGQDDLVVVDHEPPLDQGLARPRAEPGPGRPAPRRAVRGPRRAASCRPRSPR